MSYSYTTTSSYKRESDDNNFSSSKYDYTTSSSHNHTTSSSYNYTTTSAYLKDSQNYVFTVTSDYLRNKNASYDDCYEREPGTDEEVFESTSSSTSKTPKIKECIICADTCSIKLFQKITKDCSHSNDICKGCVSQHIETQLNTMGDVEGILCPFGDTCGFLIEYDDVRRAVNNDLFERYDQLSLNQALSKMPDFRWCKNAGCGSGQIHSGGGTAPIVSCKACNKRSCYTHDIPWHENLTCEEYDEARQGEDVATQDLLDRETKKCPKCGVRITKNGGCNHMTCRVHSCKYEFCWLCLADYDQIRKGGNHFHKNTCQLYAPIS